MRVDLSVHVVFEFDVTRGLILELIELSKRHYDGECRSASGRVGRPIYDGSSVNYDRNGILTIWADGFESPNWPLRHGLIKCDDVVAVMATWNDLDLVAKVCEFPPANNEFDGWRCTREFRMALPKMFHAANVKMREWKHSFEV